MIRNNEKHVLDHRSVVAYTASCDLCEQLVPVRRDHTMLAHYDTLRARSMCVASNTSAHTRRGSAVADAELESLLDHDWSPGRAARAESGK